MIRRMLGAPLGGTTCGGQYGFDWSACRLISPPNFGGGGGRYFPSIVVVAPGEPGVPVVCCADVGTVVNIVAIATENNSGEVFTIRLLRCSTCMACGRRDVERSFGPRAHFRACIRDRTTRAKD